MPVLSNIDGAEFNVYGGVTLAIPAATSYASAVLVRSGTGGPRGRKSPGVAERRVGLGRRRRRAPAVDQAADSGVVQAPKLTRAAGVNLDLDAAGGVEVGPLSEFTAGRLAVSGTIGLLPNWSTQRHGLGGHRSPRRVPGVAEADRR